MFMRTSARKGPCRDLKTSHDLLSYLDTVKIILPSEWKETKDSNTFFIDLEFVQSPTHGILLIEIAVLNYYGQIVADTLVDYGVTCVDFQKAYSLEDASPFADKSVAKWTDVSPNSMMNDLRLHQVCSQLVEGGFCRDSILVEWSTSYCDTQLLRKAFKDIGFGQDWGYRALEVGPSWILDVFVTSGVLNDFSSRRKR